MERPRSPDWDWGLADSRVFTLGFRIKKLGLDFIMNDCGICMSAPCTSLRHKKTFKSRVVQVVSLDCPWRKTPLTSDLADWETGLSQRVKASGIQSSTENTAQTAHTDRYGTEVSKADTPVGESDKYSKLILRLIMWQIISIIFCSSELNVILFVDLWSFWLNDFTFQKTQTVF